MEKRERESKGEKGIHAEKESKGKRWKEKKISLPHHPSVPSPLPLFDIDLSYSEK